MKVKKIILILIFTGAILIRFYNYENRVTFGPEQAMSLITSGRMVTEKFTLLGNQNLQRRTSDGHSLFAGALFNYSLIPLQLMFNYDPFPVTVVFTLLNLFSGWVIYKLVRKMHDENVAILSAFLFLFSSWSVYHSMFIWNQNIMFLVGTISLYFLYRLKKFNLRDVLLLGIVSGIGYTVQDLYLVTAGVLAVYLLIKSKDRIKTLLTFIGGAAVPNLPAIIFDLRHDFYHIRTATQFVFDSLGGDSGAGLKYYHFLHYLPVVLFLFALIIKRVYLKNRLMAGVLLLLFVYLNLGSGRLNFTAPTGMPSELTIGAIDSAAKAIAKDDPGNFNVAVLVDFDTRGHVLRYPLEFIYDKKPQGIVNYPESEVLYVLAKNDHDFEHSNVWELSTFNKEKAEEQAAISQNFSVYKLLK